MNLNCSSLFDVSHRTAVGLGVTVFLHHWLVVGFECGSQSRSGLSAITSHLISILDPVVKYEQKHFLSTSVLNGVSLVFAFISQE